MWGMHSTPMPQAPPHLGPHGQTSPLVCLPIMGQDERGRGGGGDMAPGLNTVAALQQILTHGQLHVLQQPQPPQPPPPQQQYPQHRGKQRKPLPPSQHTNPAYPAPTNHAPPPPAPTSIISSNTGLAKHGKGVRLNLPPSHGQPPQLVDSSDEGSEGKAKGTSDAADTQAEQPKKKNNRRSRRRRLDAGRFKTAICRNYMRSAKGCSFGDACVFAHGEEELRQPAEEKVQKNDVPERRESHTAIWSSSDFRRRRSAAAPVVGIDVNELMPLLQESAYLRRASAPAALQGFFWDKA
eukprot:Sspe_Gene.14646::Locus_5077_Transcript_1_2_Confidence_0.667_Length_1595::g.14646::m.14646